MFEVEVVVIDEVGISITTILIMEKEKAQLADEVEAIKDRGTTNPKYSAIVVKSLGIILQNVECQAPKLMRE